MGVDEQGQSRLHRQRLGTTAVSPCISHHSPGAAAAALSQGDFSRRPHLHGLEERLSPELFPSQYIADFPRNSLAWVFCLCEHGFSQVSWQTDAGRATPGPSVCTAVPRRLPRDSNPGDEHCTPPPASGEQARTCPARLPHGLARVAAKLGVGAHVPWSRMTWNSCGITVDKCVCTAYFLISF